MGRQARQHWDTLHNPLQTTLDGYQGDDSINLLIRKLADEQGYDAKVVSRMLKAGSFLNRIAGPLTAEQVGCGYAHVELVERLHQLDTQAALSILQAALANQQTLQSLRETVDRYTRAMGTPTSTTRARARSRVTEHERLCGGALAAAGPKFFGYPEGEMVKVTQSDFFSQFFLIQENRTAKVAIFGRVGDTSRKEEKAAADLLKLASLARPYFEKIWFIFPYDSSLVHELAFYAHTTKALGNWLLLGTLSQDGASIEPMKKRGRALYNQLVEGVDPLRWSGITLSNPRKSVGVFKLVNLE